jgi:chemotaxis protein methyltransferase CheR
MFQIDPAQSRGAPFCELASGRWDISALRQLLGDVIAGDMIVEAYQLAVDFPIVGRRTMLLNARQVLDEDGTDAALLIGLEDVTLQRATEALKDGLRRQHEMLLLEVQHRVANSIQIIASILLLKARTLKSRRRDLTFATCTSG